MKTIEYWLFVGGVTAIIIYYFCSNLARTRKTSELYQRELVSEKWGELQKALRLCNSQSDILAHRQ